MSKFKDVLKVIEEGLLKPMSKEEAKDIDNEDINEWLSEFKERSDTRTIFKNALRLDIFKRMFDENSYAKVQRWITPAIKNLQTSTEDVYIIELDYTTEGFLHLSKNLNSFPELTIQ